MSRVQQSLLPVKHWYYSLKLLFGTKMHMKEGQKLAQLLITELQASFQTLSRSITERSKSLRFKKKTDEFTTFDDAVLITTKLVI